MFSFNIMFRPNGKAKNVTQDVVALFVLQDPHQQKSISDNFHGQKYSKIKKLYCSLTSTCTKRSNARKISENRGMPCNSL